MGGLNIAKDFFLEYDPQGVPEYYATVRIPTTLAHVAYNLITGVYTKQYSTTTTATTTYNNYKYIYNNDYYIATAFYNDMKHVFINCITYNTEIISTVANAYKLIRILTRYMERWVYSIYRVKELNQCNDSYCLLSHNIIPHNSDPSAYYSIKCSRCMGVYSLDSLTPTPTVAPTITAPHNFDPSEADETLLPFILPPSTEQIRSSHEDWYCPYCLREDTLLLPLTSSLISSTTTAASTETDTTTTSIETSKSDVELFVTDEWGPSTFAPWLLSSTYSLTPHTLEEEYPYYTPLMQALYILCNPTTTSLIPDSTASSTGYNSNPSHTENTTSNTTATPTTWCITDRITVLRALCEVMKTTTEATDYIHELNTGCEKLNAVCNRSQFREGDFMEAVKLVAGMLYLYVFI